MKYCSRGLHRGLPSGRYPKTQKADTLRLPLFLGAKMAEIKYIPHRITFTRSRQVEEQCDVEINLPDYYSQATVEKVLYDHAKARGIWIEMRELNVTGVAIIKGGLVEAICKHCGQPSSKCNCDE